MSTSKPNGEHEADTDPAEHADYANGGAIHADEAATDESTCSTVIATVATVGVVAVGAVIFEAALIPGLALGVAAALAPQFAPRFGSAMNPLFRSTVRGVYRLGRKSREMFAQAQEHMHDIAAEVTAEDEAQVKAAADDAKATTH